MEQVRTEHDIAILSALAAANVDHHAWGVDIDGLEMGQFGATDASSVQRDEDRPVKRRVRRVDQARHLILAQDDGQARPLFRIRRLFDAPAPFQRSREEETESRHPLVPFSVLRYPPLNVRMALLCHLVWCYFAMGSVPKPV